MRGWLYIRLDIWPPVRVRFRTGDPLSADLVEFTFCFMTIVCMRASAVRKRIFQKVQDAGDVFDHVLLQVRRSWLTVYFFFDTTVHDWQNQMGLKPFGL